MDDAEFRTRLRSPRRWHLILGVDATPRPVGDPEDRPGDEDAPDPSAGDNPDELKRGPSGEAPAEV